MCYLLVQFAIYSRVVGSTYTPSPPGPYICLSVSGLHCCRSEAINFGPAFSESSYPDPMLKVIKMYKLKEFFDKFL
jgi:hypothetical protein